VSLALGSVRLATTAAATTAGASAVSLVDDHGGAALFSLAALSPGRPEAACVGLTAGGSTDPTTEVALSAAVQSGGLAPYLQVWVERGGVPAGGSCADFSGAPIWSGTLDRFPGAGTAGVGTGWRPALAPRAVYRFTVALVDDPRAEDLRTSATFHWSFTEAEPPAPAAPTTATAPPGPTDEPPPSADPSTSEAAPAATDVPSTPAPETPATSPATSPAPPPVATGGNPRVVEAPPLRSGPAAAVQAAVQAAIEVAGQAVQQVGRTAVAVAHNGQFPVALIGVVAAFLVLQGRLDQRDPKLALARVREELSEYRNFPEDFPEESPERPTTETT
jgi:hypothetical protein